jgi:DNA-binding transcriptional MerR regulator
LALPSKGLCAAVARTLLAWYRQCNESTVDELHFIRRAQALGFSLNEIGEILK